MKRLMRSRSGRLIYAPKWQNMEAAATNEIQSDCEPPPPAPKVATETDIELELGSRKGRRLYRQSMYRAVLEGDWKDAERFLKQDPSLLRNEITDRGDRALHVAVAMEHKKFVQELVQRMTPNDLQTLQDGHGYTACCYAALTDRVDIANILMKKNRNLGIARDRSDVTPLQKAALRGYTEIVMYFLRSAEVKDLKDAEWFDLLLLTIRTKRYGVALKILQKNGRTATMTNEEGTALHLLARQEIPISGTRLALKILQKNGWTNEEGTALHLLARQHIPLTTTRFGQNQYVDGLLMQADFRLLAKKLWAEIKELGQDKVVELMKNPSILHDAAKAGNAELITMLTCAYPDLIWHIDSDGYTAFHIAVEYKKEDVFSLIYQIGAMKDFIAITQDKNGNNILHLAAKLSPSGRVVVHRSIFKMQREITWFQKLEEIVPPSCKQMTNKDDLTPEELFRKQHETMLEECATWLRNMADSCLLISTIMLSVVFAAAFTVPGGYNGQTGMPILKSKSDWFTIFVISEAAALFTSIQAILHFWNIMTMNINKADLFRSYLPKRFSFGLSCVLLSFVGTLSAILSAYFLVYVDGTGSGWLVGTVILSVYAYILLHTGAQFFQHIRAVRRTAVLSKKLSRQRGPSLFSQHLKDIV